MQQHRQGPLQFFVGFWALLCGSKTIMNSSRKHKVVKDRNMLQTGGREYHQFEACSLKVCNTQLRKRVKVTRNQLCH
uniref:Putative secreted protein n=1 Tax=Anopheles triannulatus TaxID=58253 RepID=A0A2M4B7P2_9DIPT